MRVPRSELPDCSHFVATGVLACRSLFAALFVLSCTTPERPKPTDTSDELRARVAHAEDEVQKGMFLDDLEDVELSRAREANTVFAYRRYLNEFPVGENATTARALLEALRFDVAAKAGTREGWRTFLEEHPNGRKAAEARTRLGAFEIDAALASQDLAAVRSVLARFPDHERTPQLGAHEDALAYAAAVVAGPQDLQRYLDGHPNGAHRIEANERLDTLARADVLAAGDLDDARRRARGPTAAATWRATLLELERREAAAALDATALARIAASPDLASTDPTHVQALLLSDSLARIPVSATVRAAMQQAARGAGLISVEDARLRLPTLDPMLRRTALLELADTGRREVLRDLLEAVEGRYVVVAHAAIDLGLPMLRDNLPPAAFQSIVARAENDALGKAASPGSWKRVGALREATGRAADALNAWREAFRLAPADALAVHRLMQLECTIGTKLGCAAVARDAARVASDFGDERWLRPQDSATPVDERRDGPGEVIGLTAEITVGRQICAAVLLGAESRRNLEEVRRNSPESAEAYRADVERLDRSLDRMQRKLDELEAARTVKDPGFLRCGAAVGAGALTASREGRIAALNTLATLGDRRVTPFLQSLLPARDATVRGAVESAIRTLAAAPAASSSPARAQEGSEVIGFRAAAVLLLALACTEPARPAGPPSLGAPLAPLTGLDIDGRPVDARALLVADHALLLVFWSARCSCSALCEDGLGELAQAFGARVSIVLVASNADEDASFIRATRDERKLQYRIVHDGRGSWARTLGAKATPTALLFDGAGILRYRGDFERSDPPPAGQAVGDLVLVEDAAAKAAPERRLHRYARDAVEAVLAGRPPDPAETPTLGCALSLAP